jgi:MFS transporter, NNP family, nitrate/nitrite transporter
MVNARSIQINSSCFGVELTLNSAAAMYFKDQFGLSTPTAAAMASIFGWMNLFARGLGGFISDIVSSRIGMRGRIITQALMLFAEGVLVIIFAHTQSLAASIATLVFFSLFVQACEGSSYAIVPYIDPPYTGSTTGIIGAGGNVGAVCFGLAFRELPYKNAFVLMGLTILASAASSIFIVIPGHAGIIFGRDQNVDPETGKILGEEDEELEVHLVEEKQAKTPS